MKKIQKSVLALAFGMFIALGSSATFAGTMHGTTESTIDSGAWALYMTSAKSDVVMKKDTVAEKAFAMYLTSTDFWGR